MSGLHVAGEVRRGDFHLRVEARVRPGETLGIIGPNGAGKTTLLRAIAGLLPLHAGRITLADVVWDDPATRTHVPAPKRHCPVVFQDYRLFPHLTVLDNVAYGLRARGNNAKHARQKAAQTLHELGLSELAARKPHQLSGGQAQRVALARALSTRPGVLLLDEPLAALDATTRQAMHAHLRDALRSFNGPSVLITHDPHEALTLADRLLVLHDGRAVQTGTPHAVAAQPRTDFVAQLFAKTFPHQHPQSRALRLD